MTNNVFLPAIALGVATIMLATPHVAAIDRHVVSFESSRLFPDADFFGDIDPTKQSSDASDNPSRVHSEDANRSYGRIIAYPSFIQKMQKSMLGNINSDNVSAIFHDADEGDASFQEVQTLHLTKTSPRHVDCTMTVEGDKVTSHPLEKSDGLTSFYVQQADDAYLETDDDELCIPLVAGSAVSFNGALPHRTVVKSGSVKLVGPFLLSSFASVGMEAYTPASGGGFLSAPALLLKLPSKLCYTTIMEKEGEYTLVSGHSKVQFKISEDDAGETRISIFTINDQWQGGVLTLCQLAKFTPDIQCMEESLEYYADREEVVEKLWSILFDRCPDDPSEFLNNPMVLYHRNMRDSSQSLTGLYVAEGNVEDTDSSGTLVFSQYQQLDSAAEGFFVDNPQPVEGSKSGKISTTVDEKQNRKRQKDNHSR